MSMASQPPLPEKFEEYILSDGCHFSVGQLPDELNWDAAVFEEAWRLHPADKHRIQMIGREVEVPRFQQALGADYHFTGRTNFALPIPPLFGPLLAWIKASIDERLNGLLINWYDGPDHYIGPHHDSTKGMIRGAPIVTISFGETRKFRLSRGNGVTKEVKDFSAPHGTVFAMPFQTNLAWKHAVPKSATYRGRRISVTFRSFETGVLSSKLPED